MKEKLKGLNIEGYRSKVWGERLPNSNALNFGYKSGKFSSLNLFRWTFFNSSFFPCDCNELKCMILLSCWHFFLESMTYPF